MEEASGQDSKTTLIFLLKIYFIMLLATKIMVFISLFMIQI